MRMKPQKKYEGQSKQKQNVRSRTARETPQKQANSGKVVNNYFRELYRRSDGTHRTLSCFLLFEVWVRLIKKEKSNRGGRGKFRETLE